MYKVCLVLHKFAAFSDALLHSQMRRIQGGDMVKLLRAPGWKETPPIRYI